jgi:hypothetical protein
MIEAHALDCLRGEKMGDLVGMAHDLLHSAYPAIGILVARGVVPIANHLDSWTLFDVLHETRDKLYLPAQDPMEPVFERIFEEDASSEEESETLAEARRRIEAKSAEVTKLREELTALHAKVSHRTERPPARPPPQALQEVEPQAAPVEDPALRDLRKRMASLERDLKERHSERNQLRRELEKARRVVESLRAKETPAPAASAAIAEKAEDALLLEEEVSGLQPPRIPLLSSRFKESIEALPEHVVRAALRLVGRLAAGDAAAFHGSKRLKAHRDLLRQRVGLGHRLLFRLANESLEVVTLVTRENLDRTIRTL